MFQILYHPIAHIFNLQYLLSLCPYVKLLRHLNWYILLFILRLLFAFK